MLCTLLRNERGSALLVSLIMITLAGVLGATFLTLSRTEGNIATNHSLGMQALYLAESGAQMAYEEFALSNFSGRTHNADGTIASVSDRIVISSLNNRLVVDDESYNGLADERNDGSLVWEWRSSDPDSLSLSKTGLDEAMRISIRPASSVISEEEFVMEVEGAIGAHRRRLEVRGYTEPVFNYAIFSNGPLSEFTRGQDQHVSGKIHANGDLYFRPWDPRTLTIDSPSVTATGRMIRTTDIFGRDLFSGSTVLIRDAAGVYQEMALGTPGVAMDSEHPSWANDDPIDGDNGALEIWDGIVRDGMIGAVHVDPPPVETLYPGGWYDVRADLRLRSGDTQVDAGGNDVTASLGTAVREVTFWNAAIGRDVTVQELDVSELVASGNWPANGLIYSEEPLRIVGASELQADLTIVAGHSVYTKGDFNSVNKRAAAIVSAGRMWHLSEAWSDDPAVAQGPYYLRQATSGTTTVNAALVDGHPAISTSHYADLNEDGVRDDPLAGNAIANADNLLESWGSTRTLRKLGSIVHMQYADMADNVYNSPIGAEEVSWIRYSAYSPPARDYAYDPALAGMAGQPPFTPLVGRIYLWQEIAF